MAYGGAGTEPEREHLDNDAERDASRTTSSDGPTFSISWDDTLSAGVGRLGHLRAESPDPYVANEQLRARRTTCRADDVDNDGQTCRPRTAQLDSRTRSGSTADQATSFSSPSACGSRSQIESPLCRPVLLRVASPSGSQNQAFDCDIGHQLRPRRSRTAARRRTARTTTTGTHDGDKEWSDILCADYPTSATCLRTPFDPRDPSRTASRSKTGDMIGSSGRASRRPLREAELHARTTGRDSPRGRPRTTPQTSSRSTTSPTTPAT